MITEQEARDALASLKRQLARHNAGLAPFDETREQAQQTAKARGDSGYLARWDAFHNGGVVLVKTAHHHERPTRARFCGRRS